MITALLLIAHGSRRGEANADLDYVAAELRQRRGFPLVMGCYLELAQPDIAAGGRECVKAGAERVLMLPYFLSAGVHVTQDLEAARLSLATEFPRVEFRLGQPLGRHPLLIDIIAERAQDLAARGGA